MRAHFFSITARPVAEIIKRGENDPTRAVVVGDDMFIVSAEGADAEAVLEAFDPLQIEALRDRIGAMLERGKGILAEMVAAEAADAAQS